MGILGQQLIDTLLLDGARWPLDAEQEAMATLAPFIAFQNNDRDYLAAVDPGYDADPALYKVDPLAPKISRAYSSLLFGSGIEVQAASESDQERLDQLTDTVNRFDSALLREELTNSSEGELWWRIVSDPARFDGPVVTWYSRTAVIPMYLAQQVRAVAFVNELGYLPRDTETFYRHFVVHEPAAMMQVLYAGTVDNLGQRVSLERHPSTANFLDEWQHDLPMLAGRIVNEEGTDVTLGVSDFDGIEDFLWELNACLRTGSKNRALTALKRLVAPDEALTPAGDLPDGNVLRSSAIDSQIGVKEGGGANAFATLEMSFDAVALIAWTEHVAITALSRKGITPQFIGVPAGPEGYAATGTALRIRLIPSVNEGKRKAGLWLDELPKILGLVQRLDALNDGQLGFGNTWASPEEEPAVELGAPLPEDPQEQATRLATLRTASLVSIEAGVRDLHPDWDDERVNTEVEAIKADTPTSGVAGLGSILRSGGSSNGAAGDANGAPEDAAAAAQAAAAGAEQ